MSGPALVTGAKMLRPTSDERCRRDDDPQRGLYQVSAKRHPSELAQDELHIALDGGEISRLLQLINVFSLH